MCDPWMTSSIEPFCYRFLRQVVRSKNTSNSGNTNKWKLIKFCRGFVREVSEPGQRMRKKRYSEKKQRKLQKLKEN